MLARRDQRSRPVNRSPGEEATTWRKHMTSRKIRTAVSRRSLLRAGAGLAGILATNRAPSYAQAAQKKLVFANILGPPDVGAIGMELFAKEATARSKGELDVSFHG